MASLPPSPAPEPTVLDWFRSLFRLRPLSIPASPQPVRAEEPLRESVPLAAEPVARRLELRWRHLRLPAALLAAFAGQAILSAAPRRDLVPLPGLVLYAVALALTAWAVWKDDLGLLTHPPAEVVSGEAPARATWLGAGMVLAALAFLTSGGNTFRLTTVVTWFGAIGALLVAFWEGENPLTQAARSVREWLRRPILSLSLDGWALAFWISLGVATFFRFVNLSTIPLDMWSDQAEKLLDVADVLGGRYLIFFPRNTGREAIQFYLAAATARLFGTGVSFLTLKIGTAFAGWLTLPFIYAFTRELTDRRVGLAAMTLAGVAMWPNVISRTGLRFPLYAVFAAAALYLLVRGLRRSSRNEILLAGAVAGLGLHGYSPARVIPIVLAAGVALYLLHPVSRGQRSRLLLWSLAATVLGLIAFLPLLRVALDMPDNFLFRSLSRLGTAERPLPGPALPILLTNTWNALKMFNWDSGQIWVVSIAGAPLLDWLTGALLVVGAVLCVVRYARRRHWGDLFILVSIPLLMAPSILSLAFPTENPAPNRASGVMVPVFALAGWGLVAVADSLRASSERWGRALAAGWVAVILILTTLTNYSMTFDTFYPRYRRSSWNTYEGGRVIRAYAETIGTYESAHVIPYAYWWDTRLVGIQAGRPLTDYAIPREQLVSLIGEPGPQLFLFNLDDVDTLRRLRALFPQGQVQRYASDVEGHDFMVYFVPGRETLP
ncbi:MAG TPA: glycosyltransferase family 39 protein [Anaerolineales bacterium]|nr:glycosyltransferase family 39 protein [Anaerolineales bacterium]